MKNHLTSFMRACLLVIISLTIFNIAGCSSTSTTEPELALQSLSITPRTAELAVGDTVTALVLGAYNDGSTVDFTNSIAWTTEDAGVVTAEKGTITAVGVGTAKLTAKLDNATGTIEVTVTRGLIQSLAITPINTSIAAGTTQQFSAIATYQDTSVEDITDQVTWSSSHPEIATISNVAGSNGMVTSVDMGSTVITASIGTKTTNTTLIVTDAELVSMVVTPASSTIASGTQLQFTATGTFSDGSIQDVTDQITWETSNETIATVSNSLGSEGLVTTVASGSVDIIASSDTVSAQTLLTVSTASLVSIAVTPATPSFPNGSTKQFIATGTYDDASTQDISGVVTWDSSDTGIATIDAAGLATALAEGTTTITATLGLISDSTVATVSPAVLASISVTPANPSIRNGITEEFTATGTYTDGSIADITSDVVWTSSAPGTATISNVGGSEGLAMAVAPGTTTITATLGLISNHTTLTVLNINLVSIDVTPIAPSIANGTTEQFTATATFDDASTLDITDLVTWSSADMAIATISNADDTAGLATSVAPGDTTITATLGLISGSSLLTVTDAIVVSIDVTPADPSIPNGRTQQFTAMGTFSDASIQDITNDVVWDSSDTGIATIGNLAHNHGLAGGLAEGSVTITATLGAVSDSTSLTIDPAVLDSIAVTPVTQTINVAQTKQYTAMGTYSDGTVTDITTSVTWTSSSPSFATISNAGGSEGLATGVAPGTTTITATLGLISNHTTLTVIRILDHVTITPSTSTLKKYRSRQLTGTAFYSDGSSANKTASLTRWTSSNPTKIKVNHNGTPGLIRGLSKTGSSTITFTYTENGITKSTTLLITLIGD